MPLLEFALDVMWRTRDPVKGLTLANYERLGGAVGAILERQANQLLSELNPTEITQARRLLVLLVDDGKGIRPDRRQKRKLIEIRPTEDRTAFEEVLARLTDARLLVTSDDCVPHVEIAHEALIRRWGRLREWVIADREKWTLIKEVESWTHLLRDAQLMRACEAREKFGSELSKKTLANICRSENAIAEEVMRARKRRRQLQATTIAAVAVGLIALIMYFREREAVALAQAKTKDAEHQALQTRVALEKSRDNSLMWAIRDVEVDPTTKLSLLREVTHPGDVYRWHEFASKSRAEPIASRIMEHLDSGTGRTVMVKRAVFSPKGAALSVAGDDFGSDQIWYWDRSVFEPPTRLDGYDARFLPDGSVVTIDNYKFKIWDPGEGSVSRTIDVSSGAESFLLSEDGSMAFSVPSNPFSHLTFDFGQSEQNTLVDVKTGRSLFTGVDGEYAWIGDFSPDNRYLATAFRKNLVVQETAAPDRMKRFGGHEGHITGLSFSPDGGTLLTCSSDGTTRLWSFHNGALQRQNIISAPSGRPIEQCVFSDAGLKFATVSSNVVYLWDIDNVTSPVTLDYHKGAVTSVSFSSDGARVVTASKDGTAIVWRADGVGPPVVLRGHSGVVNSAFFSADGDRVLTASDDGSSRVWETDGYGNPVVRVGHISSQCLSDPVVTNARATISESGDIAWCIADGGRVLLWPFPPSPNGLVHMLPTEDESGVVSVDVSRDSQYVVVAALNGTAYVCCLDEVALLVEERLSLARSFLLFFEKVPFLEAVLPREISLDLSHEMACGELWGHGDYLTSASFSTDGQEIVTTSADGNAIIWQIGGGEPTKLATLVSGSKIEDAAFSHDGRTVVTGSVDGIVRIWPADGSGAPLLLRGHDSGVLSVAFAPDDSYVVTGAADGTVRIWRRDVSWASTLIAELDSGVRSLTVSREAEWISAVSWKGTAEIVSPEGKIWSTTLDGDIQAITVLEGGRFADISTRSHPSITAVSSERNQRTEIGIGTCDGGERCVHFGQLRDEMNLERSGLLNNLGDFRTLQFLHFVLEDDDGRPPSDEIISSLWNLTTYCLPTPSRVAMLGESEAEAASAFETCISRSER